MSACEIEGLGKGAMKGHTTSDVDGINLDKFHHGNIEG